MTRVGVAVPAAGMGRRMGGTRKPWLELRGQPLLRHSLLPFLEHPAVLAVRVALAPDEASEPPEWIEALDARVGVVAGGDTRARSVRAAVRALPEVDVILVHDAARPLVTRAVIDRCVAGAEEAGVRTLGGASGDGAGGSGEVAGVVAGWPAVDTLKEVDRDLRVVATPDRSRIWHAQTPQAFPAALLREAYERLDDVGRVTDDASLVEALGGRVRMVKGDPLNLKVTRSADVPVAELFLALRAEETARGPEEPPGR